MFFTEKVAESSEECGTQCQLRGKGRASQRLCTLLVTMGTGITTTLWKSIWQTLLKWKLHVSFCAPILVLEVYPIELKPTYRMRSILPEVGSVTAAFCSIVCQGTEQLHSITKGWWINPGASTLWNIIQLFKRKL